MAHFSGNAAWVDSPSTATLISAARLENLELAADRLRTTPAVETYLSTGYTALPGNTLLGMRNQMTVAVDPFGMWSGGGGTNLYLVTIPAGWGGRYQVEWSQFFFNVGVGILTEALVLRNCPASTVNANLFVYTADRAHSYGVPTTVHTELVLAAGDTLSFAIFVFQAGAFDLTTSMAGTIFRTHVAVSWIGHR